MRRGAALGVPTPDLDDFKMVNDTLGHPAGDQVLKICAQRFADALRESDRLKDALLASVSHDLRTPLTTLVALAHDLRAHGDERAEIIEQEADRLEHMVSDLLDLSRLNAGALTVRLEVNAVDDLLGALLQRVETALAPRRIEVRMPGDDPVLVGRFDLAHSLRILVNLVENAARHAPGTEPIEITARRDDDVIAITVADRGPGIPGALAERVFEPFFRPPGAAPDARGAGLGLSIARRLAEAQHGRLTYEPRSGGGSTFTLYVPAAESL